MLLIHLGEGTNPMGGEEFILIEHIGKNSPQVIFRNKREQGAIIIPIPQMLLQPGGLQTLFEQPSQGLLHIQAWQSLHSFHIKTGHSQERNQARNGTGAQIGPGAIGALDHVVIKAILLIPVHIIAHHPGRGIDHRIGVQCGSQLGKIVDKTLGQIAVLRLLSRENHSNLQHVEAEHGHPGRAITLLNHTAISQWIATIKHGNIIEPKETSFEHIVARSIIAIGPPAIFKDQLAHGFAQEGKIANPTIPAFNLKHPQRCPGTNRWIGIRKSPFIGRCLGIRRGVARAAQQHALGLGGGRINRRESHRMEHQIPLTEVGVLPTIRH